MSMWRADEVVVKGRYWGFWKADNVVMMKIKLLRELSYFYQLI